MAHILDRPIWQALSTRQSSFSVGGDKAKRFDQAVSPFAASVDDSTESLAALAELIPENGACAFLQSEPCPTIPGTEIVMASEGVQMVAGRNFTAIEEGGVVDLTSTDAAAMLELASLTKPGPFLPRSHELGNFIGIREGGKLIAMAGERMKLQGFTEVSAVCTHPDFRGRGLAGRLTRIVAARIGARGGTPFLHAFGSNVNAIRLYETLGFERRCTMFVTVLQRGG